MPEVKTGSLTVRIQPSVLARLKIEHRETYPDHGLTFSAWCVERLRKGN